MSLVHSPLPIYSQDEVERLSDRNRELRKQLNDAEVALQQERLKTQQIERGIQELRTILSPLYQALRHVFGEIDSMGVIDSPSNSGDPRKAAIWDSWKEKLGGKAAAAIDALHVHGEMTAPQLRIHLKCGQQTVYDTVHRLNKAGIINKNSGKISLKEL